MSGHIGFNRYYEGRPIGGCPRCGAARSGRREEADAPAQPREHHAMIALLIWNDLMLCAARTARAFWLDASRAWRVWWLEGLEEVR